jgi:membrane-associated phospholipid phosphatase
MACSLSTVAATTWAQASPDAAATPSARPEVSAEPRPARVPLAANFSTLERATTGVALVSGVTLMLFGQRIFGSPSPSLGPPQPGSFDRTWSDRLHLDDGSGHHFLWRAPDVAGYFVLPYLPALLYGIDATSNSRDGGPRLFDDPNADHRFFAYGETLAWTLLVAGVTKVVVGRERPYATLQHPELAGPANEVNVSFFSAHAAIMFAAASFVALDASRRLDAGPLAAASPWRRALLGTVLPYLVAFGTASVVAVSRVIDQQHWPSDVLVGGLVGGGIAHLAYLTHFDERGQPRGARATGMASVRLVPTPAGVAVVALLP